MIVVIADDFSGAAELAGIAASRGFSAEVHTEFDPSSQADVVAIDTDTRLKSPEVACRVVKEVGKAVAASMPDWIYKKTDSVLRGHVAEEIRALLSATGLNRCLYIPANPTKGRTIRDGIYRIDDVALSETIFKDDPDFPRTESEVTALLGNDDSITIPDIVSKDDIPSSVEADVLPAGAADFFTSILGGEETPGSIAACERILIVSGSLAAWQSGRVREMETNGFLTRTIEDSVSPSLWNQSERIQLAIGEPGTLEPASYLTSLVENAEALSTPDETLRIVIEGGATAVALIRKKHWHTFSVIPEGLTGVGTLRPAGGPLLSIKPGSYPWPARLFDMRPSRVRSTT